MMTNTMQHWERIFRTRLKAALALAIMPAILGIRPTQAQTFTTLYEFLGGTDGATPQAGLLRDAKGNLFGTTIYGGKACSDKRGCGTVFRVSATGETVLHRFKGPKDGLYPAGGLTRDAQGNLFGTTSNYGPSGQGTVFKLDQKHRFSTIHSFGGPPDGGYPYAGLIWNPNGFLYGTTYQGGVNNLAQCSR
jgi:uncharacterized repeat protein (TIGR03803 family)